MLRPITLATLIVLPLPLGLATAYLERPAAAMEGERGHHPPRPPREALEACDGADPGAGCDFETPDGRNLEGTCRRPPHDEGLPLACVPAHAPPGGAEGRPPRPPREALEACKDASDGAACSFQGRRGERMEGTCWRPDQEHPLACRPTNPPPGPPPGERPQN